MRDRPVATEKIAVFTAVRLWAGGLAPTSGAL